MFSGAAPSVIKITTRGVAVKVARLQSTLEKENQDITSMISNILQGTIQNYLPFFVQKYLPLTAFKKGNYYCPIYCGDCMSIRVANRYIPAGMELDTHWYVFIDDLKFRLHPKEQYDVIFY